MWLGIFLPEIFAWQGFCGNNPVVQRSVSVWIRCFRVKFCTSQTTVFQIKLEKIRNKKEIKGVIKVRKKGMITRVYLNKSEIRTMSVKYEWLICTPSLCASPGRSLLLQGNFPRLLHLTSVETSLHEDAWGLGCSLQSSCVTSGVWPCVALCFRSGSWARRASRRRRRTPGRAPPASPSCSSPAPPCSSPPHQRHRGSSTLKPTWNTLRGSVLSPTASASGTRPLQVRLGVPCKPLVLLLQKMWNKSAVCYLNMYMQLIPKDRATGWEYIFYPQANSTSVV